MTSSDEWKIVPTTDGYLMRCITDPGQPVLTLVGKAEDMQVKMSPTTTRSLYEWHLLWWRMVTLIEAARVDERIGVNREATEPDLAGTVCHVCRKPAPYYQAWGMRCISTGGCLGTYYPRPFVERGCN